MGLPTLFGRNAPSRERPPSDLKHVRHAGRTQRLSFGKQLRTFMCFTTEEKLSRGGGSGDKRRRSGGSLSRRLRLADSCEDQRGASPLERLSGLQVRPSTCPPDTELCPEPGLADRPSSFTLSSLTEEQLNTYLKVMFNRCEKEQRSDAAAQKAAAEVSAEAFSPGEVLEEETSAEGSDSPMENIAPAVPRMTVDEKHARRPSLQECEELIRQHERLFGPIVTSRPAPLTHWLPPQPSATSPPEACLPPEPGTTYLSIPQHDDTASCDPEWEPWRRHFSSGPDGVWRIVNSDTSATPAEATTEAEPVEREDETVVAISTKPRRLLGALRDKCSALFRHEQKSPGPDVAAVGDAALQDIRAVEHEKCADETTEKILSESMPDDVLKNMKAEEVVPCTTVAELCPEPRPPKHDPLVYRDRAYLPWSRYFRRPAGAKPAVSDAHLLDEPWTIIASPPELPLQGAAAESSDWLPASLWWGVSPLLEVVLAAADAGRLAALLGQLRPASRRLRHSGLARLVRRLDRPPADGQLDRQAVWLSRPELPQLFTAAGLGPADMTRWVLGVPPDREDDAVPLQAEAARPPDELSVVSDVIGDIPSETAERQPAVHVSPRDKFFEELMGSPVSGPLAALASAQCDGLASSDHAATIEDTIIQQTVTTDIATPATRFSDGWDAGSKSDQIPQDESRHDVEFPPVGLSMPLCSDVCTFLLPEHQEWTAVEFSANTETVADTKQAYETYGTEQWGSLGPRRSKARRGEKQRKSDSPIASEASETLADPESHPTPEIPEAPEAAVPVASSELPIAPAANEIPEAPAAPATPPLLATGSAVSEPSGESEADPVGRFDSETTLGAHLSSHLSESASTSATTACHQSLLRNSSVRPIDSEVDLAQVLHEQSGYATLDDTAPPASAGYQALPLHEVDSEAELGLALPLTEDGRPLSDAEHRQVTAYDSETEVAALMASLQRGDSETEMGERLRQMTAERQVGGGLDVERKSEPEPEQEPEPKPEPERDSDSEPEPVSEPEQRGVAPSGSVTRLPASPVQVDSETEMGVVLRLFEQGLLSSRYFADVPLPDGPDSDVALCQPQSRSERGVHFSGEGSVAQDQTDRDAGNISSGGHGDLALPIDDIYRASKEVSRRVINKALFLLGSEPPARPLTRTGSSPFGPGSGLDGIELEREMPVEDPKESGGFCDPVRVIPEVNLITSDGSFVMLLPSRPADPPSAVPSYYETEEGLVLRLERKQPRAAAESRGFQPAEAGLSLSEQELSSSRRLRDDRCADAALRRRSPSPRTRASDDGGLRVLYQAPGAEPWQPVSPEGLSGLALAPTDPELAALRWRKSSGGEDGEPETWSWAEAEPPPPPAESRSQTEPKKEKPPAIGANSWC